VLGQATAGAEFITVEMTGVGIVASAGTGAETGAGAGEGAGLDTEETAGDESTHILLLLNTKPDLHAEHKF
jgi:hypothetical protein